MCDADFFVSHEITIKVHAVDKIGELVDGIMYGKEIIYKSFEWKPLKEKDIGEEAIEEGLKEGKELCQKLGLELGRIVAIEEVADREEDGDKKDDEDEEDDDDDNEEVIYKFKISCVDDDDEDESDADGDGIPDDEDDDDDNDGIPDEDDEDDDGDGVADEDEDEDDD